MGLTQIELASMIKLQHRPTTASYICRIERGEDTHVSTVRSLARALRCKPWQLLTDLMENDVFWGTYMGLKPQQKREVQQGIKFLSERRA